MSDTINLEVPYFSQRRNKTVWYEHYPIDSKKVDKDGKSLAGKLVENGATDSKAKNSCNITCLAMITHLHLSVYITDKSKEIANKDTIKMSDSVDKIISNQSKTDFNYLTHSNSVFKIVNPFNYTESRS